MFDLLEATKIFLQAYLSKSEITVCAWKTMWKSQLIMAFVNTFLPPENDKSIYLIISKTNILSFPLIINLYY